MPIIEKISIWQGTDVAVMARILDSAGDAIQQSDLATVEMQVFDTKDVANPVDLGELTIASVVYDTLQTSDSTWDVDSTGYNFRYVITGSTAFLRANHIYRVEAIFTPNSGSAIPVVWQVGTKDLLTTAET